MAEEIQTKPLNDPSIAAVPSNLLPTAQLLAFDPADGKAYDFLLSLLATQGYVQAQIAALVGGAPELLNTLKEITDQLAVDEGATAALLTQVGQKLNQSAFTGAAVKALLEDLTGNARIDISAIKGNVPEDQLPVNIFDQFVEEIINGEKHHRIKDGLGNVIDFAQLIATLNSHTSRLNALDGGSGDVTAPSIVSRTATSATNIRIVFSEAMQTLTVAGHSFNNGSVITPSAVAAVGGQQYTYDFTVAGLVAGQTITHSYNPSTGATLDAAGNELGAITNASVTNSVAASNPNPNLVLSPKAFDSNNWNRGEVTASANVANDEEGNMLADKMIPTTANGNHYFSQQMVNLNASQSYNFYFTAKQAEYSKLRLELRNSAGTTVSNFVIDLINGTVSSVIGIAPVITSPGNGFYKMAVAVGQPGADFSAFIVIRDNSGAESYAGDGTSGFLPSIMSLSQA